MHALHDFFLHWLGQDNFRSAVRIGWKLLGALLILLIGLWVVARLANFTQRALQRASVDVMLSGFLRNLVYGLLLAVLAVLVLYQVGVSAAPLVTALGAAGLAIGLALQGSLSNLAWGVLLIVFRPFKVGDYVVAGSIEGTVEGITLMHTLLAMPDGREAVVPNSKVGGDAIVNFNRRGIRRIELKVGIGYGDDIGAAMDVARRLFEQDPRILKNPAPGIWTSSLGDSSVNLIIWVWTSTADMWGAQTDLLRAIKEHFDQAGISIPFPQREVTLVGGSPAGGSGGAA